jgi:heme exporter protein B
MQIAGHPPSLVGAARALFARDLRLLWRRRGDAFQPALFALIVVVLFALALGNQPQLQAKVAAGVLWVAALLAGLLALDSLFRGDAEDGSLEQWMLAPVPLAWLVAVRTFMHWATTAVPLLLATPFLAELLHLPRAQLPVLLVGLALGTPLLSLIGAVVAALTVGMRRSGILVGLLAGAGVRCRQRGGRGAGARSGRASAAAGRGTDRRSGAGAADRGGGDPDRDPLAGR